MPDRIALVHALVESVEPIHAAFADRWPEATIFDLLDTSLARDLLSAGRLQQEMIERFLTLGRYAAATTGEGGSTTAILFTCSAFGPAIEAVKRALPIPVLNPTDAAFEQALSLGNRIGLLVTYAPSLSALIAELRAMAVRRGIDISIDGRTVEDALAALRLGDGEEHDRLVAAEAARMPPIDCLILGQFSLARAARAIRPYVGRTVVTTPHSAVERLKSIVTKPVGAT